MCVNTNVYVPHKKFTEIGVIASLCLHPPLDCGTVVVQGCVSLPLVLDFCRTPVAKTVWFFRNGAVGSA